jgi:hypothetical protein
MRGFRGGQAARGDFFGEIMIAAQLQGDGVAAQQFRIQGFDRERSPREIYRLIQVAQALLDDRQIMQRSNMGGLATEKPFIGISRFIEFPV